MRHIAAKPFDDLHLSLNGPVPDPGVEGLIHLVVNLSLLSASERASAPPAACLAPSP